MCSGEAFLSFYFFCSEHIKRGKKNKGQFFFLLFSIKPFFFLHSFSECSHVGCECFSVNFGIWVLWSRVWDFDSLSFFLCGVWLSSFLGHLISVSFHLKFVEFDPLTHLCQRFWFGFFSKWNSFGWVPENIYF